MAGDERVGVSVMRLDEGLDTGPVLAVRSTAVAGEDAGHLFDRLALAGADLLVAVLGDHVAGRIVPVPQPESGVTVADKITPQDRPIDWMGSAEVIVNRIRALAPRPGATTGFQGTQTKILGAEAAPGTLEPGEIGADASVGAGEGLVRLTTVQPAGKQPMPAEAWLRGVHTSAPRFEWPKADSQ